MPILHRARILELHQAAVAAHLASQRGVLLGGLDAGFVGALPLGGSPSEQLLSDLQQLNEVVVLEDGTVPLKVWLETAVHLTRPANRHQPFEAALKAFAASGALDAANSLPRPESVVPVDAVTLRAVLVKHFSRSELGLLCGDVQALLARSGIVLHVSLDVVGGEGIEEQASNLIGYLDRRGHLHELVRAVRVVRPGVL